MLEAYNPAGNPSKAGSEVASLVRRGSASAYFALLKKHFVEAARNSLKSVTPKKLFLAAAAVVAILLFGRNIKDILLVAALGIAASYSTIYKRTIRVPSAVELVTFGTIITGAAYGPAAGAVFGVVTTIASEIISSGVDVNTLFYAIARGIAGGLAQVMIVGFGWSVVMAGMAALVIWHVVCDAIYVLSGGIEAAPKIIYFAIVNTLFNLIVFSFFGSLLLGFAML